MICNRCNRDLPSTNFNLRQHMCKKCQSKYNKDYVKDTQDRKLTRCVECGKKPNRWYYTREGSRTNWCIKCGNKYKIEKTTFMDVERAAARYVAIKGTRSL